MNWSNVRLILLREIRDQLRDRRTLFMIAVLPLLLYPLLGMSMFQIAQFMREHPTKVLLIDTPEVQPPLVEGDRFSAELFSTEERSELLDLEFAEGRGGSLDWSRLDSQQRRDAAQRLIRSGDRQVVVYFPPEFAERLEAFRQRLKEAPSQALADDVPSPKIYYNTASEKSTIAYTRVSRVLRRWTEQIGERNLEESRLPALAARPFDFEPADVATSGHRDAAVWSKVLPFVMLIWAMTGAFYPAIDLCAGEKERGTLETLLSSPAERSEIVWGKLLTVILFSVATSALNLLSMGFTGAFVVTQMNRLQLLASGGNSISLPPLSAVLWLTLALLPIAALFSALCLALAAFARSTKEGQYYLMPLMLITMPLMILPMAPGVELTLGNSLIPVAGVVLLLRAMLEGSYWKALPYLIPVAGVTLCCCTLAIRWAVDQFNKEGVLFRESERLELRLWLRHLVRDRGPTPSIPEALFCFVLILVTQFFISLSQRPFASFTELAQTIFVSQVVVIALPALLMTILLTRDPLRTLRLRERPTLLSIPAALLLAVVLHPVAQGAALVVQYLYPVGPDAVALGESLDKYLKQAPYAWLPFVLIGLLPAVCEELTFRGFILSGLRHIGHKWWAIGLSAVFFGVVHGIFQQSLIAVLLGLVLGYLAVQTGNLIPCIVFHVTHNSLALLSGRLRISPETYDRYPGLDAFIVPLKDTGQEKFIFGWPLILGGALAAAYLLLWFHRLPYQKSSEEQLQEALEQQGELEGSQSGWHATDATG